MTVSQYDTTQITHTPSLPHFYPATTLYIQSLIFDTRVEQQRNTQKHSPLEVCDSQATRTHTASSASTPWYYFLCSAVQHIFTCTCMIRRAEKQNKTQQCKTKDSPLSSVVLRENRDHSLQGSQHGAVDHHRPFHLSRFDSLAAVLRTTQYSKQQTAQHSTARHRTQHISHKHKHCCLVLFMLLYTSTAQHSTAVAEKKTMLFGVVWCCSCCCSCCCCCCCPVVVIGRCGSSSSCSSSCGMTRAHTETTFRTSISPYLYSAVGTASSTPKPFPPFCSLLS